jgi:hypothetical protein
MYCARVYLFTAVAMLLGPKLFYLFVTKLPQTDFPVQIDSVSPLMGHFIGTDLFYMVVYTLICLAIGHIAADITDKVANLILRFAKTISIFRRSSHEETKTVKRNILFD